MVQGQVILKGGGWHLSYLIFSRFIIFAYRNLPFAKLCYAYEEKLFCHHNFMKKGHSKLFKNEPENIPSIKITYL